MTYSPLSARVLRDIRSMTDRELRNLLHDAVTAGWEAKCNGKGKAQAAEDYVISKNRE